MKQYTDLLRKIREDGEDTPDRTGTGTRSLFGPQMEFDLRDGFPVVTTKKVFPRIPFAEMLWFISGSRNIQPLVQDRINIWNEWPYRHYRQEQLGRTLTREEMQGPDWDEGIAAFAKRVADDDDFALEWGDLGPVYGFQWRHWPTPDGREIDQLAMAQQNIREAPNRDTRRIIVSSWNAADIESMNTSGLPPCHMMYQFYPSGDGKWLDMKMFQRSADTFLGVPFNIAQYALLLSMMAQATDRDPRRFILTLGDAHIYNNHANQVDEQLSREPLPLPTLELNPRVDDLFAFTMGDIALNNYQSHGVLKAPVAI